VDGEVVIWSSE